MPDSSAAATMAGGVKAPCQYGREERTPKTAPSVVGAMMAVIDERTQAILWICQRPVNMLSTSTIRNTR